MKSENKDLLKRRLQGVSVPVITPMLNNGDVDFSGLERNIKFLVDSGIREGSGFLLILGTTGEFSNLSSDELKAVAATGIKSCKGMVPVVIGAVTVAVIIALSVWGWLS